MDRVIDGVRKEVDLVKVSESIVQLIQGHFSRHAGWLPAANIREFGRKCVIQPVELFERNEAPPKH